MSKHDLKVFVRGLKRMGVALLTSALFAMSVLCLVATAGFPGYIAVITFLGGLIWLAMAVILLYAQGLTRVRRKVDVK